MKKVFNYCLILLLLFLYSFTAADEVISAIKNGNASQLSKYIDNTVEITLTVKRNIYSKSQAELVLKDFFNNNVVEDFKIVHQGNNSGVQFIMGILETKNGQYQTAIYLKQKGNRQVLQELRFEK